MKKLLLLAVALVLLAVALAAAMPLMAETEMVGGCP